MVGEKEDVLGLSLSLGCAENSKPQPPSTHFPLTLMQSRLPFMQPQKSSIADVFNQSSTDKNGETRSSLRGFDVNQPASTIDTDDELLVSSPNSTVSSLSGKRCEREENEAERASSSFEEDDDGGDGDGGARKKLRLSKDQAAVLEETFKEHHTLNPKQKLALAKQLNLRPRQVEVWFQNRRARTKLKQTEFDCEYLRRYCETLTEENKRLHKEVNELRALKLSPQFYMNMNPPTTLTMCPQCERVAVSSSSSSATPSSALPAASAGIACQKRPVAAPIQRPMAMNPWATIITPPPVDVHRPRS